MFRWYGRCLRPDHFGKCREFASFPDSRTNLGYISSEFSLATDWRGWLPIDVL